MKKAGGKNVAAYFHRTEELTDNVIAIKRNKLNNKQYFLEIINLNYEKVSI